MMRIFSLQIPSSQREQNLNISLSRPWIQKLRQGILTYSAKLQVVEQNPKSLIAIIGWGSLCTATSTLGLLLITASVEPENHTSASILLLLVTVVYIIIAMAAARFTKHGANTSAIMLTTLYGVAGIGTILVWGVSSTVGILTLGFYLLLVSALFGSRYIIPTATGVILAVAAVHTIHTAEIIIPALTAFSPSSIITDVMVYAMIFSAFAIISWLSRRRLEKALVIANAAEEKISSQKEHLAKELKQRTQSLRDSQLQEMQQLYRFAEIGQNTTVILHELANCLSILNIDISDLKQHHRHSHAVVNAEESIEAIEIMVRQARQRLTLQQNHTTNFDIVATVRQIISELTPLAKQSKVLLRKSPLTRRKASRIIGNPLSMSQVIIILIKNAIDACQEMQTSIKPTVIVSLSITKAHIAITVEDNGKSIPKSHRSQLFQPLTSSKKHGLGIGLYMAHQIITTQFQGTLSLSHEKHSKKFIIAIPLKTRSPRPLKAPSRQKSSLCYNRSIASEWIPPLFQ